VSPWHLLRAPLLFSVIVAIVCTMVSADYGPRSLRSLRDQLSLVNADIVSNVAVPGRFTTIERGLTFHVRERGPSGALLGIFINDARDRAQATTYLAERGRILPSGSGLILVLEQGSLHRSSANGNSSIVQFDRYGFDLSQFDPSITATFDRAAFRGLGELLWPAANDKLAVSDAPRFRMELHKRLSTPFYPIAAFVIAFAFLGSPRTTRQSRGLSIAGAGAAFMAVEIVGLGSGGLIERSALAAPLPYVLPAIAIAGGLFVILNNIETRVPAPLLRLADAIAARVERLSTA
jgi:lipopolysaccharide export system permease protein